MLRYVGLLGFGLADMIYITGRISKMTSKMVDYSSETLPMDQMSSVVLGIFLIWLTLKTLNGEIKSCKVDSGRTI